ncbi:hypothetical protein V6N11_042394 [Hibiscus sabdariffa]|uniref:Uncharacterized protein n=1 Tax=Hibiscus sabdariffa TaxID=183260 RepID=A0ABR2QWR1_9ROSI
MRSRLWDGKDTYHVLSENTATEAVQGIAMDHIGEQNKTLSADAFLKMKRLRLLRFFNAPNSRDITYLSKELRLLEWHGYPYKSFPPSFEPENLVALRLPYSRIEKLWKPNMPLHRLKLVDLKESENFVNTPDFNMATNLESLDLEGTGISKFHPTIKFLRRLKLLNLRNCKNLGSFPSKIGKESLETLILSGCSNIERIPDCVGEMECLKKICLDGTGIKQLPSSIGHLRSLELLTLEGCSKLECLPSSIGGCGFLENLNLCGCSKLQNLPESLLQIKSLETLDLSKTAITTPPPFIFHMKNLKFLSFRGCKGPPSISWATQRLIPNSMTLRLPAILSGLRTLKKLNLNDCNFHDGVIPSDICSLSSLEILYLSGNNFTTLPTTLSRLSKLTILALTDCERLKSLPELPAGIQLWIDGCASLDVVADSTTACNSRAYGYICAFNCFKLAEAYNAVAMLKRHLKVAETVRRRGYIIVTPGSEIPQWFINQTGDYSDSRIKIQLPPNFLNDSQIMGFAFCCVFFSDFNNNEWRGDRISFRYGIRCRNYSREVGSEYFRVTGGSTRVTEDHLWLHYLPRHKLVSECEKAEISRSSRDMTNARFEMEVVFEIFGFHSMVKKCGVRIVYEKDLEEMDGAIDEHSRPTSSNFDDITSHGGSAGNYIRPPVNTESSNENAAVHWCDCYHSCDLYQATSSETPSSSDMDPALHRKNDPVDSFRGKRKQAALSESEGPVEPLVRKRSRVAIHGTSGVEGSAGPQFADLQRVIEEANLVACKVSAAMRKARTAVLTAASKAAADCTTFQRALSEKDLEVEEVQRQMELLRQQLKSAKQEEERLKRENKVAKEEATGWRTEAENASKGKD